ncbi:protein kinase domain-containing protein [Melittangium boletus]|uniref:protein kinase domain-containing protein n=1 Tax=Melittangium boletus TaxID=83453 RepID=UPI003DA673E2
MAEVFLAKAAGPMGFEKTLVLKRILPHLAEEPAFVEMFLSEAKLAARLTHPHIVQIFDFGESEGAYFLAMEYVDGPSLRTLIKRAQAQGTLLPPTLCARLVSDACEGLAFAHDFVDPDTGESQGLIHRDISPDNILLSRQGAVKVVDFGIAKAAGQGHRTQSGIIKGKLAYMPPEQLRARDMDRRVDVYALGVVLYELLTGQRPYMSDTDPGLMQAILFEPPVPAVQLRAELPDGLLRILDKALAKEANRRHEDCHALQAELEEYILSVGRPLTAQFVAQFIQRTASSTELSAVRGPGTEPNEPRTTPLPTVVTFSTPPPQASAVAEPPFLKRRPSSTTNEAMTANLRAPASAPDKAAPMPTRPMRAATPSPLATGLATTARPPPLPFVPPAALPPPTVRVPAPLPPPLDVEELRPTLNMPTVLPTPASDAVAARRPTSSRPRPQQRWPSVLGIGLMLLSCGGLYWKLTSRPPEVSPRPPPRTPAPAAPAPIPSPPATAEAQAPRDERTAPAEPPEQVTPPPDTDAQAPAAEPPVVRQEDEGKEASTPPSRQGGKAKRTASRNNALKGTLELRIHPYATVYVDDQRVGDTPIAPLELPVGTHFVRLFNAKLEKTVTRRIEIKLGQTVQLKVSLFEE